MCRHRGEETEAALSAVRIPATIFDSHSTGFGTENHSNEQNRFLDINLNHQKKNW